MAVVAPLLVGFLFGGTVRDNVRIARAGATDAEVEQEVESSLRQQEMEGSPSVDSWGNQVDPPPAEEPASSPR